MPRDPATGTPADEPTASRRSQDPQEIEQDIRRTRAEMSETIDEIEYRLSPDHLKEEVQDAIRETVSEVQERFHPQRIAKRAGQDMLDTVKEHPVSAMIAGVSVGYLLMQSREGRSRREDRGYDRPPYRRGAIHERAYRPTTYETTPRGVRSYAQEQEEDWARERAYRGERAGERSATERASEQAGEMKERASRQAHEMSERAGEWAGEAQQQARSVGRRVQRGARQAQSQTERFVDRNPMVAGVVALGAGALLGSMLPSTRTEDEWMGGTRDEFMHRAEEATEETMHRAQDAAQRVAEETKQAAQDVTETAKSEAGDVAETAKEEGQEVKDEAQRRAEEETRRSQQ